jgi:nicotinamidase-related amidase
VPAGQDPRQKAATVTELSPITPSTSALLVMDLQPSITGRLPDGDAFVAEVRRARDAARSAGLTVAYVRVALSEDDVAGVPSRNPAFSVAAASGQLADGDPGTAIHSGISPADGEIVVRKSRVGAFSTTDLREQLQAKGIDTLILTGISTSGVVLSTVRDAADRDFRVVVLHDGVADGDAEVHRVLTEKVFPRQAQVTDIDTFITAIS